MVSLLMKVSPLLFQLPHHVGVSLRREVDALTPSGGPQVPLQTLNLLRVLLRGESNRSMSLGHD